MRVSFLAGVLCALIPLTAAGQGAPPMEAVGNVGLHSVDVPTADLAPLESALDRAIVVNASVSRGRTATLSALAADPEVAARRAEARRAFDAGQGYLKTFQLDAAQGEFDKAAALYTAAHGSVLDANDVAKLYLVRAKLAQIRHQPAVMKEEFEHALPVHPTKQLDATQFSPDAVATFQAALEASASTPPSPASGAALADLGRRAGLKWIVAGDVRKRGAGFLLTVTIADSTAAGKSENVELPAGSNPDAILEASLGRLLPAAGAPVATTAANMARINNAGAQPVPTQNLSMASTRPVPPNALPGPRRAPPVATNEKPLYQRWYVWAGAVAVLGAGTAIAASSGSSKSGGASGPPGITLVIQK